MRRDATKQLIVFLAREIRPVRPVLPIGWEVAGIAAFTTLFALVMVTLLGLRDDDLGAGPGTMPFNLVALGLALAGVGGVMAALASSRPGRERLQSVTLATSIAALVGLASAAFLGLEDAPQSAGRVWGEIGEIPCVLFSLMLALPPALIVIRLAASAAPLRPRRTAWLAACGVTALGTLVAHLTCRTPGAWHVVLTHALLPLVGGVVLFAPLTLLLRRWQREL